MRCVFVISIVVIVLALPRSTYSQHVEPPRWHIGPFLDFSLDVHTANFQHLPGVPNCCPQFTSGFGLGGAYGVTVDFPTDTDWALGVSVASASIGATLSHEEPTALQVNGALTQGAFLHTIDATLTMISVEPMLAYSITNRWTALGGVSFGFMQSATYAQEEVISKPANGATFVDANGNDTHSRIRGQSSGGLPGSAKNRVAPFIGARYSLPLNKNGTLLLLPQAQVAIGASGVVDKLSWFAHTLRLGATLAVAPRTYNDEMRTHDHIDTVRIEAPADGAERIVIGVAREHTLVTFEGSTRVTTSIVDRTDTLWIPPPPPRAPVVTVEACGVQSRDQHAEVRVIVEESYAPVINPLLPYVFFEEDSDNIPHRYVSLSASNTLTFNDAMINSGDRLATYHHLLNIIGLRLRSNPKTTVALTGCTCDRGTERGNSALAHRRALSVQRYLHDVWGIDAGRMAVRARALPEKAANTDTEDGMEENRRVEITCNDENIMAPVHTNDTIRSVDPPVVCFHPGGGSSNARGTYSLIVEQNGTIVKEFSGSGDVPQTLDWHVDHEQQRTPLDHNSLHCTLRTTDAAGRTAISQYELPLAQHVDTVPRADRRDGKRIERFRLFLFEVRGSELAPLNAPVIRYITNALRPDAIVRIAGFTDRLGNEEYNRTLSEQRARRAAAALHLASTAIIEGKGMASLYDSALPEGRLYTRTVEVEVESVAQ